MALSATVRIVRNQSADFSRDGHFFHADGKARFIWSEPRPLPETPDAQYPFLLLTGRGSAAQWHTQTRTAKSEVLKKLYPADVYVE